jgi:hypothetical protein
MLRPSDLFERWHPYWMWECLPMWDSKRKSMNRVQQAAKLLSTPDACRTAMVRAVNEYPISAEQHLTKPNGKRPWIGQAACSVQLGALEEETRVAWNFYMTPDAQASANAIADEVIAEWELANA